MRVFLLRRLGDFGSDRAIFAIQLRRCLPE